MQNEFVLALCWTLIHSLWQGLLLAIVTGIVLMSTRRSDARKRYRLLTLLFFVFVTITATTFVKELRLTQVTHTTSILPAGQVTNEPEITIIQTSLTSGFTENRSLLDTCKDYFNTHASLIVMIWFVIFMARFVKLTANLLYIQRLKQYRTNAAPKEWKERFAELMDILGMRKQVELLESGIVKVPVVIGVLKPVILLPLGLLSQLPSDEIEAILLHELAHIQRRDYGMNLLQSFAETIFFFNPALLWLSSMMREERENCCDDMAIAVTNNKTKFINALIAFQEYHFSNNAYAVGFPGKKNQLLNRVKRIVHNRNKTLNAAEKSVLSFGMAILVLFSFAAARKITPIDKVTPFDKLLSAKEPRRVKGAQQAATIFSAATPHDPFKKEALISTLAASGFVPETHDQIDTVLPLRIRSFSAAGDSISNLFTSIGINYNKSDEGDKQQVTAKTKEGKEYRYYKINGTIKELYVDNMLIAEKDYPAYTSVISDIERAVQHRKERSQQNRELSEARRQQMREDKQRKMGERQMEMTKLHLRQLEAQRGASDTKRRLALVQRTITDSAMQHIKKIQFDKNRRADQKFSSDTQYHFVKELKLKLLKDSAGHYRHDSLTKRHLTIALKKELRMDSVKRISIRKSRDTLMLRKLESLRKRQMDDDQMLQASAATIRSIVSDLEKEGVKVDMQNSWFALDKDQFIVDGKKMSSEMHERFITRYIKSNAGWGYYYGPVKVTGRGVFLDYRSMTK
ncbi:MAG: M56 family metallopeptidase [Bacteroidota bacterium]